MGGGGSTPAQNGTVTAEAIAVAKTILEGLKDTSGNQVYIPYQLASDFVDGATSYNTTTGKWGLSISSLGGEWVARFLELQDVTNLASLQNVTYDSLKDWMLQGLQMYEAPLQTAWPDLSKVQSAGAKVLHFHGEMDNSIPPASSVRYWESVRSVMYPTQSYNASTASLSEFYRLFLVPGAVHCGPNPEQENSLWPQTSLQTVIEWVEEGVAPDTLNGTVFYGENKGKVEPICQWPLRPLWVDGTMECRYDQASIDSWQYNLTGVSIPVF
ncbi:hypothetical protein HKX48_008951 [Thoreauomyces humboldtii]|nr:hypothetical protein HKX48_008951 [Thoreauomyces humboldtii]